MIRMSWCSSCCCGWEEATSSESCCTVAPTPRPPVSVGPPPPPIHCPWVKATALHQLQVPPPRPSAPHIAYHDTARHPDSMKHCVVSLNVLQGPCVPPPDHRPTHTPSTASPGISIKAVSQNYSNVLQGSNILCHCSHTSCPPPLPSLCV